jgi:hypothetical protein
VSVLHRHIPRVGFLAVQDLDHMRGQERIAFLVELERTAGALKTDFRQRIPYRRAIGFARGLDRAMVMES